MAESVSNPETVENDKPVGKRTGITGNPPAAEAAYPELKKSTESCRIIYGRSEVPALPYFVLLADGTNNGIIDSKAY